MQERPPTGRDWTEDFDHHDPAFVRDPDTALEQVRGKCPVLHSENYGGFWMLSRYDDVSNAAQDWESFTSSVVGVTLIPPTQPRKRPRPQLPLELDPPLHTQYRGLVNPLFTRKAIEPLRPLLEEKTASLVDQIVADGSGDLISGLAVPLSLTALGAFMDLPSEDQATWFECTRRMFDGSVKNPDDQREALMELESYLAGLVAERKEERRDDFLSYLIDAELDGKQLTEDEIAGFGLVLLLAGHETTAGSIAGAFKLLAEDPSLRQTLVASPERIPDAINEFLRLFSSNIMSARNTTEPIALHDEEIPSGDVVALAWGAANRDPAVFDDPDTCILDRKPNRHLAFGTGRHLCIGAPLARLEMTIMVEQLLQGMPDFYLDAERPPTFKTRGDFRGFATLDVIVGEQPATS